MYGLHVMGYVGIALLISAISSPTIFGEDVSPNFIGRSSEDITQVILQNSGRNETNYIFSPFGYSVILGILSEGARGETREELTKVLHLPEDEAVVRQNFRTTLQRLHERSATNVPEFRNYFYVYKNFSIDDDYKNTLLENYFTDVRSVERPNYEEDFEESVTDAVPIYTLDITTAKTNRFEQKSESTIAKVMHTETATDTIRAKRFTSSSSLPIQQVEIKSTKSLLKEGDMLKESMVLMKHGRLHRKINKSHHERFRRMAKKFLGIDLDDAFKSSEVSSLSANRLNSGNVTKHLSRMIIFNGLYFRGFWKVPFQYKQGEEFFYKVNGEKILSRMLYAVGQFYVGHIDELDSTVLCLPYKGERYSFMILLPHKKDGIANLISDLKKFDLTELKSKLEQRHVQISIPAFDFKSTSYLKEPLKTIGIQKIFTQEADFKGLSKDSGLFVDDVVQLVTIKIDDTAGTPNFLTASSVQTRTVTEKFTADHPFVFFVQDHKDNIVIVAGKLYDPTKNEY